MHASSIESRRDLDGVDVAVTGANGFLGTVLCRQLVERGASVRAMVRDPRRINGLDKLDVEVCEGDVTDRSSLRRLFAKRDYVFHVAALFRQQGVSDSAFYEINVRGTENALQVAAEQGISRFVHCSTVGVHSHIPNPPANEEEALRPGDIYQLTKSEGEKLAAESMNNGRVPGCIVRPAMIWGPGDTRTLKLFKGISTRRMPVIGTGDVLLHWVLVDDVARGMILAAKADERQGETYIIAGEKPVSIAELFECIGTEFGVKSLPFRVPAWPVQMLGEVVERACRPLGIEPPIYRRRVDFFTKTRAFDWSKARDELGYRPSQSLQQEIRMIADSYRSMGWL